MGVLSRTYVSLCRNQTSRNLQTRNAHSFEDRHNSPVGRCILGLLRPPYQAGNPQRAAGALRPHVEVHDLSAGRENCGSLRGVHETVALKVRPQLDWGQLLVY